ncbi:MAG: hypothetical protein J7J72_06690 [Bacteroidales bacterium]|nr:hypothetical protein [Bacteroidales bacterium]
MEILFDEKKGEKKLFISVIWDCCITYFDSQKTKANADSIHKNKRNSMLVNFPT